jgi:hypothetical protein
MAYLTASKRIYLFIIDESPTYSASLSDHSMENGVTYSDHVKADETELSLNGEIVGKNYKRIANEIQRWRKKGTVCSYYGIQKISKCMITSFTPDFTSAIRGGCKFSMTLKAFRIAKPAYVAPATPETGSTTDAGTQSAQAGSGSSDGDYHTVKSGDTIWALVNGPYKKYGKSCQDIMAANPDAFSRPGDFRTLKVGARLKMS